MGNMNVHKILAMKETFDIISADTEFYAFMGDRLYYTFNRLVVKSDRDMFYDHCKRCSGERFLLCLSTDTGMSIYFFAKVTPGTAKENCLIELIKIADLVEQEAELRKELIIKDGMLELYNDSFFKYIPETDMIEYYSLVKGSRTVKKMPLETCVKRITERTRDEYSDEVRKVVSNLRYGVRNFAVQCQGDLLGKRKDVVITAIQGKGIYSEGKLLAVVGYVHFGSDQNRSINKTRELDGLTGLLTKAEITNLAISLIDEQKRKDIAIAIVDVDYFKKANDTLGHMYGDEILKKIAGIMEEEVGDGGAVGRIGGDEFFIVFYDADDMEKQRERLRSIKNRVRAQFPGEEGKPKITLSIGCAAYPKDAQSYEDLFKLADFAVYRAKERGRDRYIIYDKEKHGTLEEIKKMKMGDNRIDSRGNMSQGDIVCVLMDKVYNDENYTLEKLLDDVANNLGIQRVILYAGKPCEKYIFAGGGRTSAEIMEETKDYVNNEIYGSYFDKRGIIIVGNVLSMEEKCWPVFQMMQKQNLLSAIQLRCEDKNGTPCVLSLESVSSTTPWNSSYIPYYRLLARLVREYVVE